MPGYGQSREVKGVIPERVKPVSKILKTVNETFSSELQDIPEESLKQNGDVEIWISKKCLKPAKTNTKTKNRYK
jgi:hypothetical protein